MSKNASWKCMNYDLFISSKNLYDRNFGFLKKKYMDLFWLPGLSDLSSATPTPGPEISVEFQNKLRTLHSKAKEMKLEVRTLRRVQIDHMNIMKDTINITFRQIKVNSEFIKKTKLLNVISNTQ